MQLREENKFFNDEDVCKLIFSFPYMRITKETSAKRFIDELVEDGEELQHILKQYPHVLYEPLEKHYDLLRLLAVLSEELIFDLCGYYGWKGIAMASFLTILKPQKEFKKHLLFARNNTKEPWIVDLAIDEINGTSWQNYPEIETSLYKLRKLLDGLDTPKIQLRKYPTKAEIEELQARSAVIRKIYKEQGTQAALDALR
jgi:hypothetical protein